MTFYSQKSLGYGGVAPKKTRKKKSRKEMLRTVKQLVFLRSLQSAKMYLGGITTKVMYLLDVMRVYKDIFFLNKVLRLILQNKVLLEKNATGLT